MTQCKSKDPFSFRVRNENVREGVSLFILNIGKTTDTMNPYLSKSVKREESRKPLAKGLLSIFSFVICNTDKIES